MKTAHKLIVLALFVALVTAALASSCVSVDADDPVKSPLELKVTKNFDDMSGGTLEVKINNLAEHKEESVQVVVKHYHGGGITSGKTTLDSTGSGKISLSWNFGSGGTYYLEVHVNALDEKGEVVTEDITMADIGFRVTSDHSIWKDWQTYLVIVVIIIAIAIAVFIKVRGLPGSKKEKPMAVTSADKPFTKLEQQRKENEKKMFFSSRNEEKKADADEPKPDASSTEKQTYSPGKGFFKKRKD